MPSTRHEELGDYAFADKALALRKQAGLTQRDLAALLGVSPRAIQAWESGLSYPGSERLKELIAFYQGRGALAGGREEAEALWATVREKAAQRTVPFDPTWFAALRPTPDATIPDPPDQPAAARPARWDDWGEAPSVPVIQGRTEELATLARWVSEERCRLVEVLGAGGIGKTTLASRLAHDVAPEFPVVYWRSLRNALPVEEWLAGAIGALSAGQAVAPEGLDAGLGLVLELLHARRALLVLDNLESVLEPGASAVRYRVGYEGYGVVLRRLAESAHQGCLLLTSREQPTPSGYPADGAAVRVLHLEGLAVEEGRALLGRRDLTGDAAAWRALVDRYAGNPLALSIVGETIGGVFGGDLAAFLAQDTAVFGGIRELLDEQVRRLSTPERAALACLAVAREPVRFAELAADLGQGAPRGAVVEAVEALLRRSLLEWGTGGAFTLQPVVLEDATTRLVEALAAEILAGEPAMLASQAILKAPAKDYVRRSQERLIAQPLLERVSDRLGGAEAAERALLALLAAWRGRPATEQGYGPGNVLNLLRLLRGDLRGLDLSRLAIRHAYLQGVDAQDASLAGSHLSEAMLAETFNYPTAIALSGDGTLLALGTPTGEIRLWRVADRTLLLAAQAHTDPILGVALSADGRLLASGSYDGTVKLWDTAPMHPEGTGYPIPESGRLLAILEGHARGVWGVALSADGRLLVSGSADGTIKLWDTTPTRPEGTRYSVPGGGACLRILQGHTGGVMGVALSADGRLVASGGFDETVKLWDVESGWLLSTLQGHAGAVPAVALSADGRLLASGSQDGTVKLWGAPPPQPALASSVPAVGAPWRLLSTMEGHTGPIMGVALSGGGRLLASGGFDETVKLWDVESGLLLATLQGHAGEVLSVALSTDGRLMASGSGDGAVRLWEALPGSPWRLTTTLQGHTGGVWGVALSADGMLVASGSQDGTVRLWEARTGAWLDTLRGHTGGVWAVALSADGTLVASGGGDQTVRLWNTTPTSGYPVPGSGRHLATLQGHTGGIQGVALSGGGRLVASASFDGTIGLWDGTPTGEYSPIGSGARLHEHTSGVRGVAVTGDGQLVASGSYDGTVRLWDARSGVCLRTLRADRRYERLDITGLTGVTAVQRAALHALGATEQVPT